MAVATVGVAYHLDEGSWWAESADLPGYSAAAETLAELRHLVREGVAFYLDMDPCDIVIIEPSLSSDEVVYKLDVPELPAASVPQVHSPSLDPSDQSAMLTKLGPLRSLVRTSRLMVGIPSTP